ncbi:histidine kinase [Streptosporangium sp. NPDC002524]|uniref:sensor histidine kinase n=1 Tax=Streptosporangium sp. NPDC002524 TaxID=3154537 RepID=UPI0033180DA7
MTVNAGPPQRWRGFARSLHGAHRGTRHEVGGLAAPRMARAIIVAVLYGYVFNALMFVWGTGLPGPALLGFAGCLFVALVLQLAHSTQDALSWIAPLRVVTLSLQAVVTFLPFLWIGPQAGSIAGFLAGSMLLVVTGPGRWALFFAVAAVVGALLTFREENLVALDAVYSVYFTLLTGLMVYGVSSLASLVKVLYAARGEFARMAVARERLRVARDLHDLLGYNVSAMTLKSELAYRLLPGAADRARQELRDVLVVARRALAEVRVVAGGYLPMSLTAEAESAESMLSVAEIRVNVNVSGEGLPEALDTVLAIVLREAVTNVLRHSKAQRCEIEAGVEEGRARLRVGNDGVEPELGTRSFAGTGLGNLTGRLEAAGGRLTIAVDGEWFQLTAEAPLGAQVAPVAEETEVRGLPGASGEASEAAGSTGSTGSTGATGATGVLETPGGSGMAGAPGTSGTAEMSRAPEVFEVSRALSGVSEIFKTSSGVSEVSGGSEVSGTSSGVPSGVPEEEHARPDASNDRVLDEVVTRTWHLRVARFIAVVVLSGYGVLIVVNVLAEQPHPVGLAGFAACVAVLVGVQIVHSLGEPRSWPGWLRRVTLAVQTVATVLPLLWIGAPWGSMGGFLAGAVLLVGGRWRWVLYAAVGAGVLLLSVLQGAVAEWTAYLVISTLLTGLVVFGISSLSDLVAQVDRTRGDLARMAVTQERLRVARELHALLGHELSVMIVKSELAYRLLPRSADRAKIEVAEVLEIARRAVADVRAVASGYRHMSFGAEVDSSVSTLAVAGIDVGVAVPANLALGELDALLAVVLREAATNVLRHSDARWCLIEAVLDAGGLRLRVTNDGVPPYGLPDVRDDSGLGDLAARLRLVGGGLAAEVVGGEFRLVVTAPDTALVPRTQVLGDMPEVVLEDMSGDISGGAQRTDVRGG